MTISNARTFAKGELLFVSIAMTTLRIAETDGAVADGLYHMTISLETDGAQSHSAATAFAFQWTPQDREDIRWYLEDYPGYASDPAPSIASRIVGRMMELGGGIFTALFDSNDAARAILAVIRKRWSDTRVEIVTDDSGASTLPWELLYDSESKGWIALVVLAFVRLVDHEAKTASSVANPGEPVRILIVISRPYGARDVPFRAVANGLIAALGVRRGGRTEWDVLRPSTFEQLCSTLAEAKELGRPYHIVHFDGHGGYGAGQDLHGVRGGYVLFEHPLSGPRPIGGTQIGAVLNECGVKLLVLNACRSAYAEVRTSPEDLGAGNDAPSKGDMTHSGAAFNSLAQDVLSAGVSGVVAMRYNAFVGTAAQFMAGLYDALSNGRSFAEAVTSGRRRLAGNPVRTIAFDSVELQDWYVPAVYEVSSRALTWVSVTAMPEMSTPVQASAHMSVIPNVPPAPAEGFIGRDDVLLALDRAFIKPCIVLLYGLGGSGKTSTTAEFARWYTVTGDTNLRTIFTPFDNHTSPARLLESLELTFRDILDRDGIDWTGLDDVQRRTKTLDLLRNIPVLWIWDGVESITGISGRQSNGGSSPGQHELAGFLDEAAGVGAKFLLTSRHEEREWLGDLPKRVAMPPMFAGEMFALTQSLALQFGRKVRDVGLWYPLLRAAAGNPLAVRVFAGQVLRDGLRTSEEMSAFIERLRSGAVALIGDGETGYRQLHAAFAYGLEHAFNVEERKYVALLHLFQGTAHAFVLYEMCNADNKWRVPGLPPLSIDRANMLLARSAEIGLLITPDNDHYMIHPAVSGFLRTTFEVFYPEADHPSHGSTSLRSLVYRAFAAAMATISEMFRDPQFELWVPNAQVIPALVVQEENFLQALRLVHQYKWPRLLISQMEALKVLYQHTDRWFEWAELVNRIVPNVTDPKTNEPLIDQVEEWCIVTEYQVELAQRSGFLNEAERLIHMIVHQQRIRYEMVSDDGSAMQSRLQHTVARGLSVALHRLGLIQYHQGKAACVTSYIEADEISLAVGDYSGRHIAAQSIGLAYKDVPELRDLDAAEQWLSKAQALCKEHDARMQYICWSGLGDVAFERLRDLRNSGVADERCELNFREACIRYKKACDHIPSDSPGDRATMLHQLGLLYSIAEDWDNAVLFFRDSLQSNEESGDHFLAARTMIRLANALAGGGRFHDAMEYALSAMRIYKRLGERVSEEELQEVRAGIVNLERELNAGCR